MAANDLSGSGGTPASATETTRGVFCYIIYHPDDSKLAETIKNILDLKIPCQLHYEQYGHTVTKLLDERVSKATCVISLITDKLIKDNSFLKQTEKACSAREGNGFIPIYVCDKQGRRAGKKIRQLDFLKDCIQINVNARQFSHHTCSCMNDVYSKLCMAVDSVLRSRSRSDPEKSSLQLDALDLQENVSSNASNIVNKINCPAAPSRQNSEEVIARGSFCIVKKIKVNGKFGNVYQVEKILHEENSLNDIQNYYSREQIVRNLRSPFILPVLETNFLERRDKQAIGKPCQLALRMPFMSSNLDKFLQGIQPVKISDPESDKISIMQQMLRISYQLSEAVYFIHSHKIQHGDIQPKYILLDDEFNARLSGFGHAALPDANSNTLAADIFFCGKTFLSMMTLKEAGESFDQLFKSFTDKTSKEKRFHEVINYVKTRIDATVWPDKNDCSKNMREVTVNCLAALARTDEFSAFHLKNSLKESMRKVNNMPFYTLSETQKGKCVYCTVGKPVRNMLAQSTCKPVSCAYLKMCPSCMITYGRCPIYGKYDEKYLSFPPVGDIVYQCPAAVDCCPIYPAIGGPRAFALLIAGSDCDDGEMQTSFIRDTWLLSTIIQHPRVTGIPHQNIFRILPDNENSQAKQIGLSDAMESIIKQKPDLFLLYYSGHEDIKHPLQAVHDTVNREPKVANKRVPTFADNIKCYLHTLARQCPRILVIIDCCEAASVPLSSLLDADSNDDHVRYHVQWSSCGRQQESNSTGSNSADKNQNSSEFTKYLLAGLCGARTCPSNDLSIDCEICDEFRADCRRNQFVKLGSLRTFVDRHVSEREPREGINDKRMSIMSTVCREDPCIAYFTGKPLYSCTYISAEAKIHIITLDTVDGIQQKLWNALKDYLPPNIHEKALRIRTRLGTMSRRLDRMPDVILASLNDESLHVSLGTDGAELSESRHVACMCSGMKSENVIGSMTSKSPDTGICGRKRWKLRVEDTLQSIRSPESASVEIILAFNTCWETFLKCEKKAGSMYNLIIDVFVNVTLFSIAVEKEEQLPHQLLQKNNLQLPTLNSEPHSSASLASFSGDIQ